MEILKIDYSRLRNEEHYQFYSEVNDLVIRFTAEALKIQRVYPAFQAGYANEGEALDVVRKSIFTGPIADADHVRDTTTTGLCDTVDGATRHFNAEVREAARRLSIVLDSFGNIKAKGYNEQTAATKALIKDLETKYAAEVATVGIGDWVAELKANNAAVEALQDERYTDDATKEPLKMKLARKQLDKDYKEIVRLINALLIVEGPENYTDFVKEINQRVDKFNKIIAQRQGRNKKDEE